MTHEKTATLTIGRLARLAGVGIETVRYYQQRGLLPVPTASGTFRHYPAELADRIRFIKRAQELGFTLAEIGELLQLDENLDRHLIRSIANHKLVSIREKLADLARMEQSLQQLVNDCEHSQPGERCPIIGSLATPA